MADFNLGRMKFVWQGEWLTGTQYVKDDVVRNNISSYICLEAHTAGTFSTDLTADKWELMLPGSEDSFPTTTLGDIIYHGVTENERLPIGTQGQALLVDNGIPSWTGLAEAQNVYYVSEDGSDTNDGKNLNKAFASVRHACNTVTGPAVIHVKTGTYTEILPIVVPASVTIQGDGQRVTKIRPVNVTSTGADVIATSGAQTSTTIVCNNAATTGTEFKIGGVVTGTTISGTVTITAITANTPLSGFTTLTVSFTSQTVSAHSATVVSNYSGSTMFRLSDASMLNKLYMEGMTGFTPDLGAPENIAEATSGGIFVALNPASPILTKSPYVLECSSFSVGGIGAVVDGSVHASGNKSIVFHAYTCINDGGVGFWVNGDGKSEMVSCFTYFCWFGYATTAGGKIRSLSGNNSYGKYGAVSRGFNAAEVTNNGAIQGEQLEYVGSSLVGEFVVGQTISNGSGATGTITNVQTASDKIYYVSTGGTFAAGNTITSLAATATVAVDGATGQKGFVLVTDGFSAEPRPGGSIEFATGDTGTYVIQSVSGTYTNSSSRMILVLAGEKIVPSADNTVIRIRYDYSQSRLTGHDFLSIGTGGIATTNYPGVPTQAASQANEVIEAFPGRVFYVSTDQDGNFRVGDYFRVDQATGRATLNASAFDLSGLTSLRLGSIGAQLGELVNEFSSDDTLSGDSNAAVPTEAAVRGYFGKVATNLVPLDDNVQTLGTPSKRWNHVYVGPGSITVGTLTITDNAGTLEVKAGASAAPTLINAINNGTSNVSVAASGNVTITAANTLAATFSGANTTLAGELRGPATFTIDPAAVGDDTGTVVIKGNLQVDGTTTTINSTTLTVDDKNIELASVASPTDLTADGAGITIKGTTDKTLNWVDATDAWTSSEDFNLLTGKVYEINGTSVLSSTTLGSGVTASSLTSVGTLTSLTVNSGNVAVGGTATRASTTGTALVNLFNGTAPVGTLTSGVSLYSASGDFNFMDATGGAYKVGFRNVPASGTRTSSYTLATSDVGKYVQVGTSGSITIPNSTFAEGDIVSIFNNTGGNITITCSISTAYIGGTDSDKDTVTLATRGVATVMFISSTVCVITGNVT
jgi:lipopolysaccharide export system protein LptA